MTGYGKAVSENEKRAITIEIKTLNSKQLDVITRLPHFIKEKELEIRNIISQELQRGKVELVASIEDKSGLSSKKINKEQVKAYYRQLAEIQEDLSIQSQDLLSTIMRMPEILSSEEDELLEEDAKALESAVRGALAKVNEYRSTEAVALDTDLKLRVQNISDNLTAIEQFENARVERIKERIKKNLDEFFKNQTLDENRLEQEIIYYLEKLDITEEKVRLKQHLSYFMETIELDEPVGKKLNFISQEIGREINTIGSKANDADMQKIVVKMKDDLEKIKEQTLNVL